MKAIKDVLEFAESYRDYHKKEADHHRDRANAYTKAGILQSDISYHKTQALEHRVKEGNYEVMINALKLYESTLRYETN